MTKYLLYSILGEYARQFQEAAEEAQAKLVEKGLIKPEQKRVWRTKVFSPAQMLRWREPTEVDSEDEWEWKEFYPEDPYLEKLRETIARFANFIEGLEDGENSVQD